MNAFTCMEIFVEYAVFVKSRAKTHTWKAGLWPAFHLGVFCHDIADRKICAICVHGMHFHSIEFQERHHKGSMEGL